MQKPKNVKRSMKRVESLISALFPFMKLSFPFVCSYFNSKSYVILIKSEIRF